MSRPKNLVIMLDFDGVLFDLGRFVDDMEALFERYDISKKMFWMAFNARPPFDRYRYSIKNHIKMLDEIYPEVNLSKKKKELLYNFKHLILQKSSDYLLDGALDMVRLFNNTGWRVFLVSHGWGFQRAKIYFSGIIYKNSWFDFFKRKENIFEQLFNSIIVTPDRTKILAVKRIVEYNTMPDCKNIFVFVDDTARIIDSISCGVPEVITMQLLLPGCPGRAPDWATKMNRVLFSFEELSDELSLIKLL